jgi:REP element-mobilizing transposase RayT
MSSGIWNQLSGYHNRKSIRLQGYDYSKPGYYFITLCIHDHKKMMFGDVINGEMVLSDSGKIANEQLIKLQNRFPNVVINKYQIMPNHIHVIIQIVKRSYGDNCHEKHVCSNKNRTTERVITTETSNIGLSCNLLNKDLLQQGLDTIENTTMSNTVTVLMGDIVGAYKSLVSNECLNFFKSKNYFMGRLWQRQCYDRIIRNEISLNKVRTYIMENPLNWNNSDHIEKEIKIISDYDNSNLM